MAFRATVQLTSCQLHAASSVVSVAAIAIRAWEVRRIGSDFVASGTLVGRATLSSFATCTYVILAALLLLTRSVVRIHNLHLAFWA